VTASVVCAGGEGDVSQLRFEVQGDGQAAGVQEGKEGSCGW
jgi:hypothetical protein